MRRETRYANRRVYCSVDIDGNGLRGRVPGKMNENDCVVMRATKGHDRCRYGGVDRKMEGGEREQVF